MSRRRKRQKGQRKIHGNPNQGDQDARLFATQIVEAPVGGDIDVKKGDWLVAVSPVADLEGNLFFYHPPQPIFFNLIEAKRHCDRGASQRRQSWATCG